MRLLIATIEVMGALVLVLEFALINVARRAQKPRPSPPAITFTTPSPTPGTVGEREPLLRVTKSRSYR